MRTEQTELGEKEKKMVEMIAEQRGVTFEEAASQLAREALAIRVRRRTGHGPAKVYELRKP